PPSPHTINRSIFLNYPSPTGIYPLSLHDALPIWMVIAPLLLGTRTLGWMKLSSRGIPPCKDAQWWRIELIEAIARQAALALHHSRLVERSRLEERRKAILEERNRLARDIHDNLAQGF